MRAEKRLQYLDVKKSQYLDARAGNPGSRKESDYCMVVVLCHKKEMKLSHL